MRVGVDPPRVISMFLEREIGKNIKRNEAITREIRIDRKLFKRRKCGKV
jgi:hypothetical protein